MHIKESGDNVRACGAAWAATTPRQIHGACGLVGRIRFCSPLCAHVASGVGPQIRLGAEFVRAPISPERCARRPIGPTPRGIVEGGTKAHVSHAVDPREAARWPKRQRLHRRTLGRSSARVYLEARLRRIRNGRWHRVSSKPERALRGLIRLDLDEFERVPRRMT